VETEADHIDVFGPDAGSHDETILPGDQIHERRASPDNTTQGMNPQLGDDAILGRFHQSSLELVGGRQQSFAYLKNLVLCLAQQLRDLVLPVVLQLEQSRLGLADDLLGARNLRANFATSSFDVSGFPLKVQKTWATLKALFDEIGDCRCFIAY